MAVASDGNLRILISIPNFLACASNPSTKYSGIVYINIFENIPPLALVHTTSGAERSGLLRLLAERGGSAEKA